MVERRRPGRVGIMPGHGLVGFLSPSARFANQFKNRTACHAPGAKCDFRTGRSVHAANFIRALCDVWKRRAFWEDGEGEGNPRRLVRRRPEAGGAEGERERQGGFRAIGSQVCGSRNCPKKAGKAKRIPDKKKTAMRQHQLPSAVTPPCGSPGQAPAPHLQQGRSERGRGGVRLLLKLQIVSNGPAAAARIAKEGGISLPLLR